MCITPRAKSSQSGAIKLAQGSLGGRLDQAQRKAAATVSGGTNGSTILNGTPRNSDVSAIRKNTFLGV
jgi:hypothetical protein|tara:strand:+ start:58 stop:261 length:204 start_codon:yes stop_codon:yes gene_type:complete